MPHLPSWRAGAARSALEAFVARVTTGEDAVPAAERIAVFDNDGTLWTEKPMPAQLHYIVGRWAAAAAADPALADRQPYRAAVTGDLQWLGEAIDRHYAGDDSQVRVIIEAIVALTDGVDVEAYARSVGEFFATAHHPTLHRPFPQTTYAPMRELLTYLEHHGFTCYVVSGGDRDFMRPMTEQAYGIPPERVIGSALGLAYDPAAAQVRYGSSFAFLDDGPEKPVRIWSRTGRRPLLAVGNSNGDMPMLDFALGGQRPALAMLVHHDDDTRDDPAYDTGAQDALAAAAARGYTLISVRDDWATIFPHAGAAGAEGAE
ncbi:haloacid dehalogenase-like hydrolase [Microbacterium sp. W1N]|uniref:HAD family hydrolase n=1 Tax=Microbacterium festucae TaxID=2977531 RepID=UPI0021BE7419|nr:HAD family hydrolase [Microbacterium festucae]MCT9819228.1 haloacid dehalogenase-like hydrolase [Microbacterium festucae]